MDGYLQTLRYMSNSKMGSYEVDVAVIAKSIWPIFHLVLLGTLCAFLGSLFLQGLISPHFQCCS